jgi:hypothetical protein
VSQASAAPAAAPLHAVHGAGDAAIDLTLLRRQLQNLQHLLERDDFRVDLSWREMEPALAAFVGSDIAAALGWAIESYDHDGALAQLHGILDSRPELGAAV